MTINIKRGDIIYRCQISYGYGEWTPTWWEEDTEEGREEYFEKPSWEIASYIVTAVQKRKNWDEKFVFLIRIHEGITYDSKKKKVLHPVSHFFKHNFRLGNIDEEFKTTYGKVPSAAIYKAIREFENNPLNQERINFDHPQITRFIGNLNAGYTRYKNKGK